MFDTSKKIGILGGGQLGKMLCLAAANWDFKTYILDRSPDMPAGTVSTGFHKGDFSNYEDVLAFGREMDLITIEIEHVNTDALRTLRDEGKTVHPDPDVLDIIKDKGAQKMFYRERGIPTADFDLFDDEKALLKAVDKGDLRLPFVQKSRTAGYDGKGVAIIRTHSDLNEKLLPGPCLVEDLVPVVTELAVIAARNEHDEVSVFPAVEMEFHPEANLVEWLISPSRQGPLVVAEAEALAERVIREMGICGLLAVELFLDPDGRILVNEVAPRPHNSGHHTIDNAPTSQFQQHLRAITGMPFGATQNLQSSVMVNLLGAPDFSGPVTYEGADDCLALEGVNLHLYGKAETRPFRKMGHATICDESLDQAIEKARFVKEKLIIKSV